MCMKDEHLRPYAAGPIYHHEALNGTGYPNGLFKKDIPYEGQIIRVADEYDAIVSKRQYKSHIGISDTLKIIIENAQPSPNPKASDALSKVVESAKLGKNNPAIVKVLLKVVIDDIAYEISCTQDYVDYLEENIKRFKQIHKYLDKMNSAKKDSQREYFKQYAEMYFEKGETFDNIAEIEQEYIKAFNVRKAKVDNLYNEIKIIKKLKV